MLCSSLIYDVRATCAQGCGLPRELSFPESDGSFRCSRDIV